MRALVTGASGFIGTLVCAALAREGHEVVALVRSPARAPTGTRPAVGDLRDRDGLRALLARELPGCVIHLAAEIASQRDARLVHEVNVGGTDHLLAACKQTSGVAPRFVFVSTVVTGEAHGALLTEEDPLPVTTPYGRSKQECERLVACSGLPAVVVRPSHVYGPGGWYAEELVPRLRQPGRFAVIGSGANLWDVVHVDDVVAAILLAAASAPPGSLYHVVDDEPITYYEFMATTARVAGVGAPRRIPTALARLLAGTNAVDAVVRSARSSNARIKRELSWQPRFATAAPGIADALARMPA
ncbi:MAG TPA: NAD(P)-dependent oxidoreductase [Solirubrobacteraceae bacterium]|nr:NAD(P)-dependent oxidoreductase [Solirubrobacteraceae bacterium]